MAETNCLHAADSGTNEALCEQVGELAASRAEVTCPDCEDTLRRIDEDAAARDRYDRQIRRTDLSPLPAAEHWRVEVTVNPELDLVVPKSLFKRDCADAARNLGMHEACAGPTSTVRVADPNGVIVHSYDRNGGYWIDHPGMSTTVNESQGKAMSDNTETIITFTHADGRTIDIDHLGICYPENRGEFAIYEGDKQIGEFMLDWAIYDAEVKKDHPLPDDEELITQATLALAGDPRVLTQGGVAQMFAEAIGISTADPDAPPPVR